MKRLNTSLRPLGPRLSGACRFVTGSFVVSLAVGRGSMACAAMSDGRAPWRRVLYAAACSTAVLVAGCGSRLPDPRLYRLDPVAPTAVTRAPVTSAGDEQWQLLAPVTMPDYLDRSAVVLPQGPTQVLRLSEHQWAEPLTEAVPRLLRHDLGVIVGASRLWSAPVPPGVPITRQVRVEILSFEAQPDQRAVRLVARVVWSDPRGQRQALTDQLDLTADVAGGGIDAVVAAHRLALWRLAERIVAGAGR